uniref:Uncharacterized protein n=1 Tax=Zea mays TaxID=4577 RepID=A0A804PM16_MAIZE
MFADAPALYASETTSSPPSKRNGDVRWPFEVSLHVAQDSAQFADAAQHGSIFGPGPLEPTAHRGLMIVANVDDSRVVLDTASDDDAITPSSSSST